MFNSGIPSEYYITHDSMKKSPPIKESKQAAHQFPWGTANVIIESQALKLLKYKL